jgi:predicted lipoprotein with Yx(FWY)xxD motif
MKSPRGGRSYPLLTIQEQEFEMTRIQVRSAISIAVCLTAATALVACGSKDSSTTASTTAAPASGASDSATVALADSALGQILVDANGMTVYLFEKDTSGDASACSGACAQAWPPVTVNGEPQGGDGVDASKLTTLKRDDGTTQVAYNGHPLYLYAGDSAAGDTNGNGLDQFGAEWYAMTAAGESAGDDEGSDDSEDSTSTSSSSSGGYSY